MRSTAGAAKTKNTHGEEEGGRTRDNHRQAVVLTLPTLLGVIVVRLTVRKPDSASANCRSESEQIG